MQEYYDPHAHTITCKSCGCDERHPFSPGEVLPELCYDCDLNEWLDELRKTEEASTKDYEVPLE